MPTELKIDSPLQPQASPHATAQSGNGGSGPATPSNDAAQTQARDVPEAPPEGFNRPIAWEKGICKVPLRKKVPAHGEDIDTLTLKEPTALDIETIGQPVTLNIFDTNPRPVYEPAIMTAMLSHLGTVPLSTIRKLDPRDWQNAALAIFRFFIPDKWTAG